MPGPRTADIHKEVQDLRQALTRISVEDNAKAMGAYMKGHFIFHGIKSPDRKAISNPYVKRWATLYAAEPESIVKLLWQQGEREYQYIAMEFLARSKKVWNANRIELYHHLLVTKSWWDTVDMISSTLVGGLILSYPKLEERMDAWNASDNIWLVRCSLLYQLKYGRDMELERLEEYILRHHLSKEFFIQKAMGWALRQAARFHADWVLHFVEVNRLPALTKREALKHFNE